MADELLLPDEETEALDPAPAMVEAPEEATPAPLVAEQTPPAIAAGEMVRFVQADGSLVRKIVLNVASDGGLTLLHVSESVRGDLSGVRYDAGHAPGTWHEVD